MREEEAMTIKLVETCGQLTPGGHYSYAAVHNGVAYLAGQLPVNPETGEKVSGSAAEQTRQVLKNLEVVLAAAGSDKSRVLKATVYVADISLWDEVNREYAAFFGAYRPARTVVPTKELHFGFLVEMDVIAAVGS